MKQLFSIGILCLLAASCNQQKVEVAKDLSVHAEIIETGDIGGRDCAQGDDSCYYYYRVVRIVVKNNSSVPKSFRIMKCSWQESFTTDNEDISFLPRDCNGNYPIQITLPASETITFHTLLKQKPWTASKYFKIGLIMLEPSDFSDLNKISNASYKKSKKTIWSSPVSLSLKTFGYIWKE